MRTVRNFWIEGQIDGRSSKIAGGPGSKDGGFDLTIYQRNDGSVARAARITGWIGNDGKLMLDLVADGAELVVREIDSYAPGKALRVESQR